MHLEDDTMPALEQSTENSSTGEVNVKFLVEKRNVAKMVENQFVGSILSTGTAPY